VPRLLVITAVCALLVTGSLLAWPQLRGWIFLQRTPGRILDVVTTPLGDGKVALAIGYEYLLPRRPGVHAREFQIGWQIGDPFFHPIPDPVVEAGRSEAVVRALLDADQPEPRMRTVFFASNDPVGTAFILDETAQDATHRVQIGAILVGIGILLGFYTWRQRRDS
jgi:hypothetical protein